jgi:hypothetical protein
MRATTAPSVVSHSARTDWPGYRMAMARSAYAALLVLVMLLPANFIAAALSAAICHGDALLGARYADQHHLAGYWVAGTIGATEVTAGTWWAAALFESLFWASCVSGVLIFVLWIGRLVALRLSQWMRFTAWHRPGLARAK